MDRVPGVQRLSRLVEQHRIPLVVATLGGGLALLLTFLLLSEKPWHLEGGPGFFAAGPERPLRSNIRIGFYYASALNAFLCVVLLLTATWWTRPLANGGPGAARPEAWQRGTVVLAVLAAVLLALALRWPLAHRSLWWDEAWVVRTVVVGSYAPQDDRYTRQDWDPGGLRRSLWHYEKPTNHVLYSVASFVTVRAWQVLSGAPRERFDEFAYRLPAVTAALLSVALAAALLSAWGFPRAGVLAAFLLALHPWHIRYGVDGRAYSLVVLFTLSGCLGLTRLLRTGAWRDCVLFAGSQLLLLWTFPYGIFVTAGLSVAALIGIATCPRPPADRWQLGLRFGAVNLLAAMALIQVFAPNLTQIQIWDYPQSFSPRFLARLGSELASGMPWRGTAEAVSAGLPNLQDLTSRSATLAAISFVLLPGLFAVGFLRLWRRGGAARTLSTCLLAAAPLAIATNSVMEQQLYTRYLIFLLPLVVCCWGLAIDLVVGGVVRARGRVLGGLAALLLLASYQLLVWPQTKLLLSHPYAPLREVAAFLADAAHTEEAPILRAGYGLGGGMPSLYDWEIRWVGSAPEIHRLCQEARESARPLYIFYGYPRINGKRGTGTTLLENPDLFELRAEFWGIEADFHYRVFRHRGGSCDDGDGSPASRSASS